MTSSHRESELPRIGNSDVDTRHESETENRRLHVLHVIGGLGPGGAEAILYRLIARSPHIDHRVICFAGEDWYSSRLADLGIPVEHLNMTSFMARVTGMRRLLSLVRQSGADVVQGWMYRANLMGGLFAKTAGIPSVWGIHCASLEPLRFGARLFVYASGAVARWVPDYVINCSKGSVPLHDRLGFGRAPGGVVHNGYDPQSFRPDKVSRARVRQELGIDQDEFLIGSVSRWHQEKDIPNLLEALRIFRAGGQTRFRCLLVGNLLTGDNDELQQEIVKRQLQDVVIPLGRRSDVPDIMRAMDLHVLPSRSESFPNTVAEAMLSGTPCIVTDAGDAPFMVGQTGWVAPPQDSAALAEGAREAYREFGEEPEAWQERRLAARQRIAENFTLDKMAAEYEAIWRSVAAGGKRRRRGSETSRSN
jgi:glycosyltransferase involved in cell wall biosynthesis